MTAMREIKFRGFNGEKWLYGDLAIDYKTKQATISDDRWWRHPVRFDTVGQFTGLKDSTGKEIYEGDIIEMNRGCYERNGIYTDFIFHAVVCWVKNGFMYKGPGIFGSTFDNVKVIGNVYDNPDLLEATE